MADIIKHSTGQLINNNNPSYFQINGISMDVKDDTIQDKDPDTHPGYNKEVKSINKIKYDIRSAAYKPLVAKIKYPHIAIGTFARAFRDYIHYSVYGGFKGIVFGAYNKFIQSYLQRMRYAENEEQKPIDFGLPIFSYTFEIEGTDEKLDFPWRNSTWFPGLAKSLYPSFYEDEDFSLKVVFRRLKGTISSNIYCNSQAELLDIQMAFLDGFRGTNNYSQVDIRAMTLLPNEIFFTDYHGRRFSKLLTSNNITKAFIPAINKVQYYIYNNTNAIINMASMSSSNQYYGATNLPEYALTGTFNFELEVPSFVLCMCKSKYSGIELNIDVYYKYEDNKVEEAIRYITGKSLMQDVETNPSKEILSFENGWIIDRAAFTITNETIMKIPCYSLFEQPAWHFQNKDIVTFIIYPGGVIRLPIDNDVAEYDEEGNIVMKMDLFNVDDFLEIYIFKFNKDIEL